MYLEKAVARIIFQNRWMGFKFTAIVNQTVEIVSYHPMKYYEFRMGTVDFFVIKIAI